MNYIFFIVLLFYPFTSPSLLCITDAAFEETLLEEESNPLLYDSSHSLSEGESIAVDDSAVRAAPAPPSVAESAVAPQVHPPEEAESYIRSRKDERKQMREQRREQRREFKLQRNSERAIPHLPGQLERTFLEEAAKGLRETGAEEEIRKQVVEYLHASKGSGERPSLDGALEYVYSISLEKGVPANEPAKEYLRGEGTYSITSGDVERNPVAAARKAVITGRSESPSHLSALLCGQSSDTFSLPMSLLTITKHSQAHTRFSRKKNASSTLEFDKEGGRGNSCRQRYPRRQLPLEHRNTGLEQLEPPPEQLVDPQQKKGIGKRSPG